MKIVENYYEDKVDTFSGYDRLNRISFVTCLLCTAIAVAIVALRLDKIQNCLIMQWCPVMFMSLLLAYNCCKLIGFGGMLYTGCTKLEVMTQNFNISRGEEMSGDLDSVLTPVFVARNTVEMQVLNAPLIK
jgi:hypothetical protein